MFGLNFFNRGRKKKRSKKKTTASRKAAPSPKKKAVAKTPQKEQKRIESSYPHFRDYKKSQHPALIVGEQKTKKTLKNGAEKEIEEYKFRKVMHDERDGRHLNETVYPNPNPNDPKPMHIAKRVRHDEKKFFGLKPKPWKYQSEDEKK